MIYFVSNIVRLLIQKEEYFWLREKKTQKSVSSEMGRDSGETVVTNIAIQICEESSTASIAGA